MSRSQSPLGSAERPNRPARTAAVAVTAALAWLACGAEPPQPQPARAVRAESNRPARIILFSMDTVRADRISGYAPVDTTPNLAQIAAEGAMFRNFYAASSFTLPSTMSMLTGLDPIEHGIWSEAARLSDEVPTLAETLRRAGYRTQAFHEGGYVGEEFGFARGFDEYQARGQRQVVEDSLWGILDWMRSAADEPYFLFLHTYAAHDPYGGLERYRREAPGRGLPDADGIEKLRREYPRRASGLLSPAAQLPAATRELCTLLNQLVSSDAERLACGYNLLHPDFPKSPHFEADRKALLAGYDERIRTIDRAIGKIRDLLVELGQWDDTLLVVTADHGEAFFEHGLFRHNHVPFDEVLKVPLFVSIPKRLRDLEPRVISGLTWQLDLMPTILAFAEIPVPESLAGRDLSAILLGSAQIPDDRALFPGVLRIPHEGPAPLRRVVVRQGFKYIEGHPYFGDEDGFLFDLRASADERSNLRERDPERFSEFAALAREYASGLVVHPARDRSTGAPITAAPGEISGVAELDPQEEAALRALGYRD